MNRIIPFTLAFALFMEQMDSTVIATALPTIAYDIGTSPIALKLALTAYLVSVAIFIPLSGWMADRFGAKRIFLIAIGVFMFGSLACAGAWSLPSFVGARFLQGMGGSMMTPIARLILVRGTEKSALINAMAWLTIPALLGPVIGPPLGGFITTYASWHWIFLINIPIGIAGIAATLRFLPEIVSSHPGTLDFTGFLLAGIAASGVIFGLSVISLPALPPVVGFTAVGLGMASGLMYVFHTKRTVDPILRLTILQQPVYRATVLAGSLFRIGNGALPFLLPLMLQLGFGLSPFRSGMITFITAAGAIAMKFGVQKMFARFGFKAGLLGAGVITSLLILAVSFIHRDTPLIFLYAILLAMGFTRSLFFTGLNALSFSEITATDMSHATAFNAASQQLSIAAGVALAGGVLEAMAEANGGQLTQGAFDLAFVAVSVATAFALLPLFFLGKDAGNEMAGQRS